MLHKFKYFNVNLYNEYLKCYVSCGLGIIKVGT
jgi:hypothetical protein